MERLVKQFIPAIIAILVALLMLLGYLFPNILTFDYRGRPAELRHILVEWAVIISAFAFLLGLHNLFRVHIKKARRLREGGLYSLVFLLAAIATSVVSIASLVYPPAEEANAWIFEHILVPAGAALSALLVFTLTLAAFRLLRTRQGATSALMGWAFILIVAIALLGGTPLTGILPQSAWLTSIRTWLVNTPGMAGMRGLLLGIALGTVVAALRALWLHSQA